MLGRHVHRGELRSKIRTGAAHETPPMGDPAEAPDFGFHMVFLNRLIQAVLH
jgi:hypothetical protein